MISNPKIVLIDELFSFVDPIVTREMTKYIFLDTIIKRRKAAYLD